MLRLRVYCPQKALYLTLVITFCLDMTPETGGGETRCGTSWNTSLQQSLALLWTCVKVPVGGFLWRVCFKNQHPQNKFDIFLPFHSQNVTRFFFALSPMCSVCNFIMSSWISLQCYTVHSWVDKRAPLQYCAPLLLLHHSASWTKIFAGVNHYMAKYE